MAAAPAETDVETEDERDAEDESEEPEAETDAERMMALKRENELLREALREKDAAIERLTQLPAFFFGSNSEDGFNADKCDVYSNESTLSLDMDTESTVDSSSSSLPSTPRLLAEPTPSPSDHHFSFKFCLASWEVSSESCLEMPTISRTNSNDGPSVLCHGTETQSSLLCAENVVCIARLTGSDTRGCSFASHLMKMTSSVVVPPPR